MASTSSPISDPRSMILAACRALFAPGQVTELRMLGVPGRNGRFPVAGWFNNAEVLAKTAANFDQNKKPEGIYCTLNPVHDACMARSPNGVTEFMKTLTTKKDILRRHWLPIDVDPAGRPTAGISSTDAEIVVIREVARAVSAWLESELHFPPGLRAFSGNGVHLLYRVDLPNDPDSESLVKRCLVALDQRFGTEGKLPPGQPQCKIDTVNANADRIFKLYGTMARKGTSTEDRPHRQSRLFSVAGQYPVFADIAVTPRDALDALAAFVVDVPSSAAASSSRQKRGASKPAAPDTGYALDGKYAVDLDAFIAEHAIPVTRVESFDGTGCKYILDHCVFDESHVGTSAALGREPSGAIWYACQHNSCSGKKWRDVAALFPASATLSKAKADAKAARKAAGAAVKPSKPKDGNGDGKGTAASDDAWGLAKNLLDDTYTDGDTGRIFLRRYKQTFYRYSERRHRYVEISDDTMRVQIARFLGERVDKLTTRKIGDVLAAIGAMVTLSDELEMPFVSHIDSETHCSSGDPVRHNWITMANGILDIDAMLAGKSDTECLMSHTSEWFSTTSLPFEFPITDEARQCPTWQRFLSEVLSGDEDRISLLQEAFGACFLGRNVYEVFFVLHGVGRNGKSTVLNVLRTLLSQDNVSSLSMEQLAEPNFVMQLDGKIANICDDMNAIDQVAEGLLKSVTTGALVSGRRLYRDPVQFRPRCIPWFSCNTLPRFSDTSMGIWRRMVLIPFDLFVADADVDVHLFNRLYAEMPGILMWAIQGTLRLQEQGGFTPASHCAQAMREYRLHCLPILMWVEECVTIVADYVETVGDLWRCYRSWCRECGLSKPKPIHQFAKDLAGFLAGQVSFAHTEARSENMRQVSGLRIRPGIDPGALSYGGEPL